MLKQGKMLVMLDGFDEVPKAKRPLVARWLNAQMRTYKNSVFILTSRPKAYTEQDPGDRLDYNTLLWVRNFNPEQRRDFIQKWYWCQEYYHHGKIDTPAVRQAATEAAEDLLSQIAAREELSDLTKNPLLLNMIALFHRRYPSAELPKRRVELYQEMCVLQLRDRPGARKLETLLADCDAQTILQMLALEMMQRKEERVDQETVLERLTQYLRSQDETVAAPKFLHQIEQISELIVQREPEEFEFAHLSFQEYLAVREVVRLKQESLLYDHFGEDWWKSVILLYAAQVKPSQLIRAAIHRGATDLAYACYQETTKRIDAGLEAELSALKQTVQASRYAKLEEYLKTQQWQAADQETYRLMITTVGKEAGQWFASEELLNFPCEELRAIDGLWVSCSNGRFGFSVQKQIYVDCGAELDGNYPGDRIWEDFCDRVGWRMNNQWIGYSEVTFSTQTLSGHLPLFWGLGDGWGVFSSLAQRFANCNTKQS
jgi:predicted NACHT family NTPase